jgi:MFS family permease
MADLLPTDKQGRWWGIRQMGVMGGAALARMGFGWYLDSHRGWDGYLTVYVLATAAAVVSCNVLYLFVAHPKPERSSFSLSQGMRMCFRDTAFRRFLSIFLVWFAGIALVAPAIYRFMRERVGMGVTEIAFGETLILLVHTAFGFLWGYFADRHGRRGALVACLTLNAVGVLLLLPAGPGGSVWVYLTFAVTSIGGSAVSILMWPMLFSATETMHENRATAMAVFSFLLSFCNALAFNLVEPVLFPLARLLFGGDAPKVFIWVILLGAALRLLAAGLALRMPAPAHEVPPGIVVKMFTQTSPLRAAIHLVRYVTVGGREGEVGPLSGASHKLEEDAARALKRAVAYTEAAKRSLSAASPSSDGLHDRDPDSEVSGKA